VALELFEATGDVQLQMLARGEVDAGFVLHSPGAVPLGLMHRTIAQEVLVVALPDRHVLAEQANFDLAKVLTEPLVIFPRHIAPSLHDLVLGVYHAHGASPEVAQEAIQMQTIVNLVSAGLGVAWVPESVMQFQRPGVVYRRPRSVSDVRVPACETSLVWRSDIVRPSLERFLAFVSAAQAKRLG
jgi:DNA-binding transcriptional LysR family regulator